MVNAQPAPANVQPVHGQEAIQQREFYKPLINDLLTTFEPELLYHFTHHGQRIEEVVGWKSYYESLCEKHGQAIQRKLGKSGQSVAPTPTPVRLCHSYKIENKKIGYKFEIFQKVTLNLRQV